MFFHSFSLSLAPRSTTRRRSATAASSQNPVQDKLARCKRILSNPSCEFSSPHPHSIRRSLLSSLHPTLQLQTRRSPGLLGLSSRSFLLLTQYRCHETTLRDSRHHPLGPPLHLAFSHALDSSL